LFGLARSASPGELEPGSPRAGLPPENEESQRTQTDDEEEEEEEEEEEVKEHEVEEVKEEEEEAEEAEGNVDRRSSHLGVTWAGAYTRSLFSST